MRDVLAGDARLRLGRVLPRAGLLVLPAAYLQRARRIALAVLAAALLVTLASVGLAWIDGDPPRPIVAALFLLAALVLGAVAYRAALEWPRVRAAVRSSRLEGKLPYAVNYLSTMASGGLGLDRMMAQLGAQTVYGPVGEEARLIHRDLTLLGLDVVAALQAAIERSPSAKFQDFLQGLLTTVTSGGDLRLFLAAKSDQYFAENRTLQARFLDRLALLAEVFVVLAVATPLFIIVLLSVLTVFGRSGPQVLVLGYATILLILPVTHAAFAATIRFLQPEA